MAGPPNSVAVASALPTHYFANTFGVAASAPSGWNIIGHPVVLPGSHTAGPSVVSPVQNTATARPVLSGALARFQDRVSNPLAWWREEIAAQRFGIITLPGGR